MPHSPSNFSAEVGRFKAIAAHRIALERNSARHHSFLNDDAIDAFSKIEGCTYAGQPSSADKSISACPSNHGR